jgi:hypothetical protein
MNKARVSGKWFYVETEGRFNSSYIFHSFLDVCPDCFVPTNGAEVGRKLEKRWEEAIPKQATGENVMSEKLHNSY